jgi:N6-L-threonylcarbamoyladenine synthase
MVKSEIEALGGGLILGIESSCDETAAAVVRDGREVLSNAISSQVELHAAYGGVVPELASREHLRNIVPVVRQAMEQAGVGFPDLDAVAVTQGPGLAGALLVGILYAKGLAFALGKPLIAVNHLEGHIHAVLMGAEELLGLEGDAPLLALVVSGGHTHLYLCRRGAGGAWSYQNVGRTIDDAAGEAFDKVAKLLGLGYPGGPEIDRLAVRGNPQAVPFTFHPLKQREDEVRFDFSFSGIKTAVLRYTQTHDLGVAESQQRLDLIASFQSAVVGSLLKQTMAAAAEFGARGIVVSGGVAANRELRRRFSAAAAERGLVIGFPGAHLATDNAAMIAAAAYPHLVLGDFAAAGFAASPQMKLGG